MRLDSWTYFNLPNEARQMIDAFASPDHERSIVKNIPIGAVDQARAVMLVIQGLTGHRMRMIYRGPRPRSQRCWCPRDSAQSLALYFR